MPLITLSEQISFIPATRNPFSCDVVFINGKKNKWIFDCGTTEEIAKQINAIHSQKEIQKKLQNETQLQPFDVNIVISHFHPDHILNLAKISYDNLYVSKYTKRYTFRGIVVDSPFFADDFLADSEENEKNRIKIYNLPSSHAKGSLCLSVGDYTFMGDGTYAKELIGNHYYNAQLLKEMIDFMETLDTKYFCLSHDKNFIQNKDTVIELYKEIYRRKKDNNPKISVEDFFNADGSVKEQ